MGDNADGANGANGEEGGNTLLLAPQPDGTFKVQLKDAAGGRLKATSMWAATTLVTVAARHSGYERYDELPASCAFYDMGFPVPHGGRGSWR